MEETIKIDRELLELTSRTLRQAAGVTVMTTEIRDNIKSVQRALASALAPDMPTPEEMESTVDVDVAPEIEVAEPKEDTVDNIDGPSRNMDGAVDTNNTPPAPESTSDEVPATTEAPESSKDIVGDNNEETPEMPSGWEGVDIEAIDKMDGLKKLAAGWKVSLEGLPSNVSKVAVREHIRETMRSRSNENSEPQE
ncbi:MAG: hypothetical protein KAR06_04325 [Deltaproteobacteria bacterium]|nr:hypothetical protein [Deltaproteobacteria bacterium]